MKKRDHDIKIMSEAYVIIEKNYLSSRIFYIQIFYRLTHISFY